MKTPLLILFLTVLMLLTGCGPANYATFPPPADPCANQYFSESACEMALNAGGYWHYGQFYRYPSGYNRTVVIYRDNYNSWLRQGNRPIVIDYNQPEYRHTYVRQQPQYQQPRQTPGVGDYNSNVTVRPSQPRDPITGRFVKAEPQSGPSSYTTSRPSSSPSSGSYSTRQSTPTTGSYTTSRPSTPSVGSYSARPSSSSSYTRPSSSVSSSGSSMRSSSSYSSSSSRSSSSTSSSSRR